MIKMIWSLVKRKNTFYNMFNSAVVIPREVVEVNVRTYWTLIQSNLCKSAAVLMHGLKKKGQNVLLHILFNRQELATFSDFFRSVNNVSDQKFTGTRRVRTSAEASLLWYANLHAAFTLITAALCRLENPELWIDPEKSHPWLHTLSTVMFDVAC